VDHAERFKMKRHHKTKQSQSKTLMNMKKTLCNASVHDLTESGKNLSEIKTDTEIKYQTACGKFWE